MTDTILIDTDILIDVSRNITTAVNRIKEEDNKAKSSISVITNMELIVGCRNKNELSKLNNFLSHFYLIDLDQSISKKALELLTQYRLSHGLLIPDALIAASAITFNIPLLTKNQSDYRFITELNLLSYP
ncbi:type II toxin-antitoxin system VapC family toxin [Aphanothece sacrum]|uniref:PIN domain protein n=1 Tax=Aphanothece sacrum FPU1 TaxID=1920663 RepID=A0A401INF5_APHSA|nr:type II toxin-antitoxin system VapC family toxin [Aphanothece sacrum]GBF82756.1 PIN domain protein [Aphanothece sacrum FPU1]